MPDSKVRLWLAGLLVAALAIGTTRAERISLPTGVFYYHPAASVFGGEAAWINPAALALYGGTDVQLMAEYSDGDYAKSWGMVINRERLAVAYRKLDTDSGEFKEYVFASGLQLGKMSVGGSYRKFTEAVGILDDQHIWNLGLILGQGKWRLGGLVSNLNRVKIDGVQSETEQRYSLSYRPSGNRLTASVDMFLSTGTRLSKADYVYHADVIPYLGLHLTGFVDSDKNWQIGMRANLLQYFVGSQSTFDRNGHNGRSTAWIGATSMRQPSLVPYRQRRLSIGITSVVPENPPQPVFGHRKTAFVDLITVIYRAAEDPTIAELVLSLSRPAVGFGRAQELRKAITYFRAKGKRVDCHLSHPNNIGYYIACAADRIFVSPVSQLNLVGLRAELTFYAGTLEKLGVKIEMLHIGDHKTAPEKYTRRSASEANREQLNRLLDDLYDQFVGAIARGRHLPADSVLGLIDEGPFTPTAAVEFGLVDGLSYRDELKKDFLSALPEVSFRRYRSDTLINDGWPRRPRLAIIVADGEIGYYRGGLGPFQSSKKVTPATLRQAFSRAVSDKDVKGVVLRIDSPGGLALAGDEIYHSGQKAAEKKPLVTSMAGVAASGGYYMAMATGKLYANQGTITGSIGIFGGKADLSGLYSKLDVGTELFTRGRHAGMLTTLRPFTDEERGKYLSDLEAFYDHFVEIVAGNRSLSRDSVDHLSRGRVWTGREAYENGLVDHIGGIKMALDDTAADLGLSSYDTVIYPRRRPFILLPAMSLFRGVGSLLGVGSRIVSGTSDESDFEELTGPIARLPYDIEIK